jgi:hypothetical protein
MEELGGGRDKKRDASQVNKEAGAGARGLIFFSFFFLAIFLTLLRARACGGPETSPTTSSPFYHPPPKRTKQTQQQGKRAVIFGVPDMGDVCTNKHVPSFLEQVRVVVRV